ncbi:MAG: hypothetical protein ACRDSJ_04785, partial [Rubrobacteraceae bacterium]
MSEANAKDSSQPSIQKTLDLLDPEKYYFGMKLGTVEDGWVTAASLVENGGKMLFEQLDLAKARYEMDNRSVGMSMPGTYGWAVGGPAVACYVLARRVPDISPENVALRFGGDRVEVALVRERFAVLP